MIMQDLFSLDLCLTSDIW